MLGSWTDDSDWDRLGRTHATIHASRRGLPHHSDSLTGKSEWNDDPLVVQRSELSRTVHGPLACKLRTCAKHTHDRDRRSAIRCTGGLPVEHHFRCLTTIVFSTTDFLVKVWAILRRIYPVFFTHCIFSWRAIIPLLDPCLVIDLEHDGRPVAMARSHSDTIN
ncbi:hypothetical protein ARMSODRAFT_1009868 [Armillaria solidipes]|uniref:Uncharacterized protein n=1 Tax=Armillaria solidipes TaxID=1076256 RepID=A0A2H3B5G9_9AGAR|nr:hypothetical protein ARMSODRAFT_1009868 [Armillaria solidipes]